MGWQPPPSWPPPPPPAGSPYPPPPPAGSAPTSGWRPPPPLPPSPPRRSRREIWGTIGIIALALVGFTVRVGLRVWLDDVDNDRGDRPAAASGYEPTSETHPYYDTVSARNLSPGACTDRTPTNFTSVRVVPCAQPHVAEIVAIVRYPVPPGTVAVPPILDLFRVSLDECRREFDAYIGTTPDQTPAKSFATPPSESEWKDGERLIVCFATSRNGEMLTGSVRVGAR